MPTETTSLVTRPTRLTDGLSGFERFAVGSITALNQNAFTKYLSFAFTRYVSQPWIMLLEGKRIQITGGEHVAKLDPPKGVLLVSNHRTMWDMYVACSVWLTLNDRYWRMYFPVRRTFFYTHPVGWLVNLGISAGGMWPPMDQTLDRSGRTAAGLEALAGVLAQPRTIVGIHPEGTRNKGPDPLKFLDAKGGIGRVVKACDPGVVILPYYMDGLSGNLKLEFQRGFAKPGPGREPPIRIHFGAPVPVSSLDLQQPAKVLAREILSWIHDLGTRLPEPQPDPIGWPRTKV